MFNSELHRKNSSDLISSQCVTHLQLKAKLEDPLPARKKWDNPCSSHHRAEYCFCRTQTASQRIKKQGKKPVQPYKRKNQK